MDIVSEVVKDGVVEKRFDLKAGTEVVPGCLWLPEGATGPRTKVLIGHGGSQHKKAAHIRAFARRFALDHGWATVAIDGPGHGDRVPEQDRIGVLDRLRAGTADPIAALAAAAAQAEAEWKATLDAVEALPEVGTGKTGYWGVSMGTLFGTQVVANDPRISCAVLGLAGVRGPDEPLVAAAARIDVPVLFVLQREDELFPLESGIALFDAIGTKRKSLHVNPGAHAAIPTSEIEDMHAFYARVLL